MYKWELCGRVEWADTREQAAELLGATDPNEVRFAGYCEPARSGLSKLDIRDMRLSRLGRWLLGGKDALWDEQRA